MAIGSSYFTLAGSADGSESSTRQFSEAGRCQEDAPRGTSSPPLLPRRWRGGGGASPPRDRGGGSRGERGARRREGAVGFSGSREIQPVWGRGGGGACEGGLEVWH